MYLDIFLDAMKNRFKKRIHIDLYSGSGMSERPRSSCLRAGSPFIALDRQPKFDHYIFCEKNGQDLRALEARIASHFPDQKPSIIPGDCNEQVDRINQELNKVIGDLGDSTLTFCFIDPYALDVHFETIKKLAENRKMDFMINIMLGLDVKLNWRAYLADSSLTIANFLGSQDWRNGLGKNITPPSLSLYVGEKFSAQMASLGYLHTNPSKDFLPFENSKSRIIYYIGFFSKGRIAFKFWDDAKKYGGADSELFSR
jgi:three-Cys-motif partner protein